VTAGDEQRQDTNNKASAQKTLFIRPFVAPFARALDLLSAFGKDERCLGNLELSKRADLPSSTVTRLAHTLVSLGYLHYHDNIRKFSLASSVLSLGYGALDSPIIHQATKESMSSFTRNHNVHLILCSREKLDLIVIDSYKTPAFPETLQLEVGAQIDLSAPVAGWALMAGLPEYECSYLSKSLERKTPHSWSHADPKFNDALHQVRQTGFCTPPKDANLSIPMVAAPLHISGSVPLAIACLAPRSKMSKSRLENELGPALVSMTNQIVREVDLNESKK
jgi:DNA-binding IclR family transcriptional regulator